MAQAQSPHDGDDPLLSRTASTEDGHATRREGRLRRAISRMVRAYEPPETEQGFPVHQPVHPHSQNPGGHPSGTGGGDATGPNTRSAEDGYRPAAPASVPNPYTTPRAEVDDVDDGTAQVGTWRGVGLDEPEPRSPQPHVTTTDTMTDTPFSSENAETDDHRGQPAPGHTGGPAQGAHAGPPAAQPPGPAPGRPPADPPRPAPQEQPPAPAPQGWGEEHHRPAAPPPHPGQHPGQYGYAPQPPAPQPPHYDPYYYARPPAPPGHQGPPPAPHGYAQQGYGQQAYGHPQQGEYPAPPQQPYPPHPMTAYQHPYPAPYQPPGYFYPGQPVMYPSQFGQPVQHVIVFTPGQQPQVITADAVASTLVPERTDADRREESRSDERALTTAEPGEGREDQGPAERSGEERAQDEPASGGPEATEQRAGPASEDQAAPERASETPVSRIGADPDLLNEALAGLAMRDLSLVDALLEMVEALETDAQDPDLLDQLFQIDNYATRMRRNGENFLVLTGHDGGASDAHDEIVPLLDVARAASSEIKDYPRVRIGTLPQTSVTGLAADDVSHLLAELLDNATANSPEHSPVTISAQEMDDGRLMIVVEDEGVGIPDRQLADLNERLSGEPVLDDEVLRHMGLYVASRIAHKHGLETRLESRSYRGVSAYAIIPKDLLRVATPRTMTDERASSTPSSTVAPVVSMKPTGPVPHQPPNGSDQAEGGNAAVTSAGLPRRSATPHGSPLRMMPRPEHTPDNPPSARDDTPPKLTGDARAEQIRDELGDFFDGERAARDGEELDGGE